MATPEEQATIDSLNVEIEELRKELAEETDTESRKTIEEDLSEAEAEMKELTGAA